MPSHRTPAVSLLSAILAGGVCTSIACSQSMSTFTDSGQSLGNRDSWSVALGDFDRDGDLDAMVANYNQPNTVWTNDGNGTFTNSGQGLGNSSSYSVALGDLDGDGDLDAMVANGGANTVWTNDGNGIFTNSGQALGDSYSWSVALGDLDGDGDLDAMVANNMQPNTVWTNDGNGTFTRSEQEDGNSDSHSVALGDLDGDGDLDAVFANGGAPTASGGANVVWTNDGNGKFTDFGQELASNRSTSVALGDLDGDGDLDAVFGNTYAVNTVWMNNGTGTFSQSQAFGVAGVDGCSINERSVVLGDMDLDGDLDAIEVTGRTRNAPNTVWINKGTGFEHADRNLFEGNTHTAALGDLDGDGDLDVFFGNAYGGSVMCAPQYSAANRVWFTQAPGSCCLDENCASVAGDGIDLCLALGGTYIEASCLVATCEVSESTGACCVASGCTINTENACTELGGSWTESGSCDNCPTTCSADLNGDSVVDGEDLAVVLGAWGLPCDG